VTAEPPKSDGADHVTVADAAPLDAGPIIGALVTVPRDDVQASVTASRGVAASRPTATQEEPVGQLTEEKVPPPELSGTTSIESDQLQLPPASTPVAITGKPL